jgi:hypothetical protein
LFDNRQIGPVIAQMPGKPPLSPINARKASKDDVNHRKLRSGWNANEQHAGRSKGEEVIT